MIIIKKRRERMIVLKIKIKNQGEVFYHDHESWPSIPCSRSHRKTLLHETKLYGGIFLVKF